MQKYHIHPIHPGTSEIPEGLARNENHLCVKIGSNWFSFTQKGDAIQIHGYGAYPREFGRDLDIFIEWIFAEYKWCKALLLTLNKRSLERLAIKHGFNVIDRNGQSVFLMRKR